MVDLEAHCLPPATIVNGGAVTWEWGSLFLMIQVPYNCFLDATVWVLCAVDLGELASLWLLPDLSMTGPEVELVAYKIKNLFGAPVLISLNSPALCMAISFTSFAITVNFMGSVDRPEWQCFELVCPTLYMKSQTFPGLFLYWYVEVGVLEIY